MVKRIVLAVIVVFVAWVVMDFVIHGVLLMPTYEETAELWRPQEEMQKFMPLMHVKTLLISVCFVLLYGLLVDKKNLATGIKYGVILGLMFGISMGLGSYSYSPIPLMLAVSWFAGVLVEMVTAGAIVGAVVKK